MANVLMIYKRALGIVKNATTLTLLMARGERPTMRGLIPVNGQQPRRKRICGRIPPSHACPAQNVSQRSVDKHRPGSRVPGFFAFCPAEQKEIKSGEDQVGSRGGRGEQFLPVIPPKLQLGGRVREGRGWNRGNLGCGSLVGYPEVPLFLLQRGGIEQQPELRRQPHSSLNCRGLAASSWCEGLECGRPPHTARPTKAYQGLLAPRSTPAAALSVVLNMSHFLAPSTRGKLIWVIASRDMTQTINVPSWATGETMQQQACNLVSGVSAPILTP